MEDGRRQRVLLRRSEERQPPLWGGAFLVAVFTGATREHAALRRFPCPDVRRTSVSMSHQVNAATETRRRW
jgi:hypothetical protein